MVCHAKIKSDQTPQSGIMRIKTNEQVEFEFNNSQISIAPGQACVFYKSDELLGGGWISKEISD